MWVSKLKRLRWITVISGISNIVVIGLGGFLVISVLPGCGRDVLPIFIVLVSAGVRIMSMIGTGIAQEASAITILRSPTESSVVDSFIRHERRTRYKRWLWWTRFAMIVTVLQLLGATYLIFSARKFVTPNGTSGGCFLGTGKKQSLLVFFLVMVWFIVVLQCFTGSDVLRWRSFYATHDNAWKAHYREVFDHGIREALCCLGRVKYFVLEEDEVYSVARLLGDLVAYRATGTGHLELLSGLALLQRHELSSSSYQELMEAPIEKIQEAALFHQFAEAAYTGPLLDFGRNPILFPCSWLYRQGVFTPWTRSRRPVLEGDNWWRGHAAAFLRYVNLSAETLKQGRVSQVKREAAYFVVVLHHMRTVVIAVRGTETPEDLLTDGLCRECTLSAEDLDGLIKSLSLSLSPPSCVSLSLGNHVSLYVKQTVASSFPHYGHSGIIEAARELYMQIDGNPGNEENSPGATGLLSSLLGAGCECDGYSVRIVGHSLGGAIGTLLGIRSATQVPTIVAPPTPPPVVRVYTHRRLEDPAPLASTVPASSSLSTDLKSGVPISDIDLPIAHLYRRYPNLRVYAYGPLPCVDSVVAEACSEFVTSILYNDEFSSRLSVCSILRLRAAAITALSQDSEADSAMVCKLARQVLYLSNYHGSETEPKVLSPSFHPATLTEENNSMYRRHLKYTIKGGVFLCTEAIFCMLKMPDYHKCCLKKDKNWKLTMDVTFEPQGVSNENSIALIAGSEQDPEFPFQGVTELTENPEAVILKEDSNEPSHSDQLDTQTNPLFEMDADVILSEGPESQFMDVVPSSSDVPVGDPKEVFLPGLVIHIVPQQRRSLLPLWRGWRVQEDEHCHRAYIANRENFKDIVVSPSMFLDHLPWRRYWRPEWLQINLMELILCDLVLRPCMTDVVSTCF
ncbi:uncharacterized protein LOC122071424 isoform X2 [Macadamia integrifolia]|uniref:uncharacterized protein LOC122071424 isoform X2 n=1 Tax=Macadamia integrifolia TaxID=60698 RepID=UPI001C4E5F7D|nr:uncharacterized protein LOC122071424 isoform X2 [Macadamia integrifolia]